MSIDRIMFLMLRTHGSVDPFVICSRLGPIHTGPVCTALERIRPKGVRMQDEAIHA